MDPASVAAGVSWWEDLTGDGGEGMVQAAPQPDAGPQGPRARVGGGRPEALSSGGVGARRRDRHAQRSRIR
ncbi:hypothetical protein [Cellulomonas sp. NS3]|uniref:hypothetical protein n=1 Tax=Cellulomonas sp. NS3 TaxID=2973977 RepID=UPI0037C00280